MERRNARRTGKRSVLERLESHLETTTQRYPAGS